MNTIYINSENSKTSDPHRLLLKLMDKIDLRRKNKYIKNMKTSYKVNNKFKMLAPIWNEEFELPDGSYLISDIQDYFVYIVKKQEEKTVNP